MGIGLFGNSDKDSFLRIPASLAVKACNQGLLFFTKNISMTGMFMEGEGLLADHELKIGDTQPFEFFLPSEGDQAIEVQGKVVRREKVDGALGSQVHAIAIEYVDLNALTLQQIRLFISSYEDELDSSLLSHTPAGRDEITDPEGGVDFETVDSFELKSYESHAIHALEVMSLEQCYDLCAQALNIDKQLARQENVDIQPEQLLVMEALEQIADDEHEQLSELLSKPKLDLKQRTFLKLLLMKIKLISEKRVFQTRFQEKFPNDHEQYMLSEYHTAVGNELAQLIEAANLVGQRMITEECWDEFRSINSLRGGLNVVAEDMMRNLQRLIPVISHDLSLGDDDAIEHISVEECVGDVESIIPDPNDEVDSFESGLQGDDIVQLWEGITSLPPSVARDKLIYCLAVRHKVRHDYYACIGLASELRQHREEVISLYRDDARYIVEASAVLRAIEKEGEPVEPLARSLRKYLEALSVQFGLVMKTIPDQRLTTEEIEVVRYRRKTFRRKKSTF